MISLKALSTDCTVVADVTWLKLVEFAAKMVALRIKIPQHDNDVMGANLPRCFDGCSLEGVSVSRCLR